MFKKTLAAAALLGAFAGSAVAADVTLYGVLDYGLQYTHVDSDKANTDAVDNFQLSSGNQSGARFGLKGSEDLGNGVKAGFHLENGFSADTGSLAQNSRLFGREARLFVNGAFGEVAFGRMGTLGSANGTYGLLGNLSPFGASWVGAVEYSTYYVGGIRADNTVTYKTPTVDSSEADSVVTGKEFDLKYYVASVGYKYDLSKRTNVYGVLSYAKGEQDIATPSANFDYSDRKPSMVGFGVGLRHNF